MPTVEHKGIEVNYREQGKGPAVVLIHGFLENLRMWERLTSPLAAHHRIVSLDLPGHGSTPCLGYTHTMDEMAQVVKTLLVHLGIRKATLIGHSMGGYVALAFAEHYPESVRSLILYQSHAGADAEARKLDRDRSVALVRKNKVRYVRQAIRSLFRPVNLKKFKEEVDEAVKQASETPAQGIIAALVGMRNRPNREILLTFPPYPVYVIASDKDPIMNYAHLVTLSKLSNKVRLITLKGCGHMSYIESYENTLEAFHTALRAARKD